MIGPWQFRAIAVLSRSPQTVVLRGRCEPGGRWAILKTVPPEARMPSRLAGLAREWAHLETLADRPGIVRPMFCDPYGPMPGLLFDDLGASALSLHRQGPRLAALSLADRLQMLARLARILQEVHAAGLLHRDVNPSNIIWHPGRDLLCLIDFSLAGPPRAAGAGPAPLEGTPAYLAPEQTGRLAAPQDQRLDLYSFGVTAYELLTGVHPFGDRPAEALIHAHLTEAPPPLAAQGVALPPAGETLFERLLAKHPDERPASAEQVAAGLTALAALVREGAGVVARARPGRASAAGAARPLRSAPACLLLPRTGYSLVGRQREMAWLRARLVDGETPGPRLIIIEGVSGIGKSALASQAVRELAGVDRSDAGSASPGAGGEARPLWLCQAKGEPSGHEVPLGIVRSLFGQVVRHGLSAGSAPRQRLADALAAERSREWQSLTLLDPAFQHLGGLSDAVASPASGPQEGTLRLAWSQLARAVAAAGLRIILLVDDLPLIDAPSRQLLEFLLMIQGPAGPFTVVATWRTGLDGEPEDRLAAQLEAWRTQKIAADRLALAALTIADLQEWLASVISPAPSPARLAAVAAYLHQITKGNPLGVVQILRELAQLADFDPAGPVPGWQQAIARIGGPAVTGSLLEILSRRVQEQPTIVRRWLHRAACLGHQFEPALLAAAAHQPCPGPSGGLVPESEERFGGPAGLNHALAAAHAAGLVNPVAESGEGEARRRMDGEEPLALVRLEPSSGGAVNSRWRFTHDQVRVACLRLFPETEAQLWRIRLALALANRAERAPEGGGTGAQGAEGGNREKRVASASDEAHRQGAAGAAAHPLDDDRLFTIAALVEPAVAAIIDADIRWLAITWLREAGERAFRIGDLAAARRWIDLAVTMVDQMRLSGERAAFRRRCHEWRLRVAYRQGDATTGRQEFAALQTTCTSSFDRLSLATALAEGTRANPTLIQEGVDFGLRTLGHLWQDMPRAADLWRVLGALEKATFARLQEADLTAVRAQPAATDRESALVAQLVTFLLEMTFHLRSPWNRWLACQIANRQLSTGRVPGAANHLAFLGMIAVQVERYDLARRVVEVIEALQASASPEEDQTWADLTLGGFILPWVAPLTESLARLQRAQAPPRGTFDPGVAEYAWAHALPQRACAGHPWSEFEALTLEQERRARITGDLPLEITAVTMGALVRCMLGKTACPWSLSDDRFDHEAYFARFRDTPLGALFAKSLVWLLRVHLLYDRLPAALELVEMLENRLFFGIGMSVELGEYHCLAALIRVRQALGRIETIVASDAAARRAAGGSGERAARLARPGRAASTIPPSEGERAVRSALERAYGHAAFLERAAAAAPFTFQPKHLIVQAHLALAEGRPDDWLTQLTEAIALAEAAGFHPDAALAHECLGRWWYARGCPAYGQLHIRRAVEALTLWEARPLADRLRAEFAHLFLALPGTVDGRVAAPATIHAGVEVSLPALALDAGFVLMAARALAGEFRPAALMRLLLRLMLQASGARRAQLVQPVAVLATGAPAPDAWDLLATAEVRSSGIVFPRRGGQPALSPLRFVQETKQPLVVRDAQVETPWSQDPVIRRRGIRSLLVLPLTNQSRVVGFVTLEHDRQAGAFEARHLDLLGILAAQAAGQLVQARDRRRLRETNRRLRETMAQRAAAQRELKASEQFRRTLLDHLDAIVGTTDAVGRLTYLSANGQRAFPGWPIGPDSPPLPVLLGGDAAEVESWPWRNVERHVTGPAGRRVFLASTTRLGSGDHAWVFTLRDITQRRALEERLLHATEAEQQRLGRELHDGLCQHLVGGVHLAALLHHQTQARAPELAATARTLQQTLEHSLQATRLLSHDLSLYSDRLTLAQHLERLAVVLQQHWGVRARVQVRGRPAAFTPTEILHLFRIAQEAARNAIQHGRARTLEFRLSRQGGQRVLAITNDGQAFPAPAAADQADRRPRRRRRTPAVGRAPASVAELPGIGLRTMEYRAHLLAGRLYIQREPPVTVMVKLPPG
ncbi:MAG: serine/threonine protein kinase [Candidatus Ozemobacter sibiricus]|uniref:Serine/threonine protein kinase n=1 Tax=Candidatus Ozemobacter sibiricus TaxID=2268124 RepID=A0A367ZND3_9BACT|nr:MAG: serine/threonine protein kinase [Candidatus Ozemobacter sibiricus]